MKIKLILLAILLLGSLGLFAKYRATNNEIFDWKVEYRVYPNIPKGILYTDYNISISENAKTTSQVMSDSCQNKPPKIVKIFEQLPPPVVATGWGHVRKAIICEDIYFIEDFTSSIGPVLYGPFTLGKTELKVNSEIKNLSEALYSRILVDGKKYATVEKLSMNIVKNLDIIYADVTGDKNEEAIVEIPSGGTAGNLGVLIYSVVNKKVVLIDKIDGGGAATENNQLVIRDRYYLKTDRNCCPSFFDLTTYDWNGNEFVPVGNKRISAEELNTSN